MKQSQRIVKNVLAGSVAACIGGLLQLAAVVLVARTVSVTDFGTYSFILAFAVFIQLLADSGLTNILVRELATKPERMSEILGAALSLVWALSIGGELIILAVVPFLHFDLEMKLLTLIMGAATLSLFHSAAYGAALRSQEDNELNAIGYLGHKFLIFLLLFIGLKLGLGLVAVVMAELIPNIILCCFYGWLVVRRYARPKLRIDLPMWKYLLTNSIPVGGATMARLLAQQVDIIILSWLTDAHTVGLFSGPYRISMALRFIPQTMAIPLYPMYSRLAVQDERKAELQAAYERSVKFFVLAGFPVATIFVIFSGRMISLLLGDKYQGALVAMQLLGVAFLPFFVSSPFPFLLTALDKQRYLMVTSLAGLVLRIAMNFALIPFCGYLGPCIAFFASEALLLVVRTDWLTRLGFPLHLGKAVWRPTVASCCMGVALYFLKSVPLIWLAPLVIAGLLAYLLVLLVLGTFTAADLRLAKEGLGFVGPLLAKWSKQATAPK
jgi:O-antigen/teichoic acid export membrane protein